MRKHLTMPLVAVVVHAALSCGGGGATVVDEAAPDEPTTPSARTPERPILDSTACAEATGGAEHVVGDLNRDTIDFEVSGGVRVILKRTPDNPVVAVRLYIDGGSRDVTADNAGVVQLAVDVATSGGTETLSKTELSSRLNAMGSAIGAAADFDYTSVSMSTLDVFLDETWALFRDVLLHPAFPESEIELVRERQIQSILMRSESPDTRVADDARAVLFEGHPYANRPEGTAASVAGLTRDELMSAYQALFDPSRMLLVVVGDIGRDELEALIGDTFAHLTPSGSSPEPLAPFTVESTTLTVDEAPLPTNYVIGIAPAPNPVDEDYPALMLAHQHLSDRLFEEVRTIRNLSYAVSAGLSSRLANYCYLYVTTVDPAATLPVMVAEVERLRDELLTDEVLEQLIAGYVTSYYQGIDSNSALASQLGWWQLYGGGRENADNYIRRLEAVTPEDIRRVSAQYMKRYQFAVVGAGASVSEELFTPFDFLRSSASWAR